MQHRRPLHPISLVSPRDGSSFSLPLALGEANFSCFNRRVISSGEPANVRFGNYSDDAGPARLSETDGVSDQSPRRNPLGRGRGDRRNGAPISSTGSGASRAGSPTKPERMGTHLTS